MGWFHVIAIGVILGLAAGSMAERVLVTALVQSVAAFLVALVVSNVSTLVWWTRRQAGSGYFGLGVENLLYLAILCIGAAALHVAWVASVMYGFRFSAAIERLSWAAPAGCGEQCRAPRR